MAEPRCICCGQPAANKHHAIYRQHIRQHGGSMKDKRNLVPVAFDCHMAHHSGAKRFRLRDLPDSVFEYAEELLGSGLAYETLGRYYSGDDPRLGALLAEA